MAFSTGDTLWRELLWVWPLERLRDTNPADYYSERVPVFRSA